MMTSLNLTMLERMRDAVNADRDFRRLGTADVRVGIKVGEQAFLIQFEAFECSAVSEIAIDELRESDFYVELSQQAWQTYLAGRQRGTAPSLVSLEVDAPDGIIKGTDPLQMLKFERYHLTLQSFLDSGARLAA